MKRNIIVRQQDAKDCGVCCLLSIIKFYDGYVPLEKLRLDTNTSLEGTNAYYLVKASAKYGFDSYGIKIDTICALEEQVLPAIAHVNVNHLNHFVVIYKIDKNNIYLMDPAKGKVKMKKAEFETIWTQNIIILYPKYQLPKLTNKNYMFQMIYEFLKKEKSVFFKILILTAFLTLITIFTGFYFKIGIYYLNYEDKNIIITLIILFLFFYFLKFFIVYLRNCLKLYFNRKLDSFIYYDFVRHLFLLPNYFIKDRTTGEIMVRIKELENIKEVFSEVIITIVLDSILAFSVGVILYHVNYMLFFFLCFLVILYMVSGIISGKLLYKKVLYFNESEIAFQNIVIENLDSFVTLKNLNLIKKAFQKAEIYLFKFLGKSYQLNKLVVSTTSISYFLEEFLTFGILSIGFLEIFCGKMQLVDLITFESLVPFFINPFKNMVQLMPSYNYVKLSLRKLNDFYSIEEEVDSVGFQEFQNDDIFIENLTFSYTPFSKLFEKLNLRIPKNKCVLFKGKSGCGKSTLCQMISRLLEVKNNNIKIGKVSLNDYSLDTIRKNITYVSQKEHLIQDTIKNNIVLYREIKEEKLKEILEICEVEDIVSNKALRYETFLAKDSMNISGGERQRIILARALLNNFQILILDEALSEVNQELEIRIIQKLKKYFQNKTIIYVSHKNHEQYFDSVYDFGELK